MSSIGEMPGHLARRFQQIAVAVFHEEVGKAGFDMTPVQYAALSTVIERPGIDQATLAGLIAYDRATIGGVVDRLVAKGFISRRVSDTDRRARELFATESGKAAHEKITPAVNAAQQAMLQGLQKHEAALLLDLLGKTIAAGNDRSRAPLRTRPEPGVR